MKICKYYNTNEENDHICKKCKKYNDCFRQNLYEEKEETKEEKHDRIAKTLIDSGCPKELIRSFKETKEEEVEVEEEEQIQGGFTDSMCETLLKIKKEGKLEEFIGSQLKEKVEEKSTWSADGIPLIRPNEKQVWVVVDGEPYSTPNYINNVLEETFKTKERAELERDRKEVEYIMKKMACESRDDNDWRRDCSIDGELQCERCNFTIGFAYKNKEFITVNNIGMICLNESYFLCKDTAQKCLDYLIEKYGFEKLKNIWGVKN